MRRGEDLARHYAAMDVLLFASETETFGNVLLEGMASGLATVSYRYAASADMVLDGINGLQAEKGDEEGFYSAMRRLLEDGEMIRRLGKQARRTVNSRTWDSIHDRFEELLASVAREENGTGCARPRGMPCWNAARFFVGPSSGNERLQGGRMPEVSETCPDWKIVLVGDIVDAWALSRGSRWRRRHTRFVRTLLKRWNRRMWKSCTCAETTMIFWKIPAFSFGRFENCQGVRAPGCGWKTLPVRAWGRF